MEKQFKKQSCRVPWNTVGPVKHSARRGKNGRVPGWRVGQGKKTVFVGYKDQRCDFSGFRAPFKKGGMDSWNAAYKNLPHKYQEQLRGSQYVVVGGFLGVVMFPIITGMVAGRYYTREMGDEAELVLISGGAATLTSALMMSYGARGLSKKATESSLRYRKSRGKKKRKLAKPLVDSCFDKNLKRYTSAAPGAWDSARSSCEELEALIRPGAWEYGKLGDKTPAELAVRAANQVRALGGVESRGSMVSQCLAKKPTTKNKYVESCSGTDGNQAIPKGLQMANSCRLLLDELSALGSSGRKIYPIKDLRRTVEAQEKAVATARKTGRKWREEKDAACAQDNKKAIAKDRYCKAKYGRGKSTVTATFECTTTGMVKTRPMNYQWYWSEAAYRSEKANRGHDWTGTILEVDGCTLLPTPALPTNCPAWHRLR